jgi:hypothetical protein
MDGGVCSQIRTGLDPELPDNWLFAGNFCELSLLWKNAPGFAGLTQWLASKFPR